MSTLQEIRTKVATEIRDPLLSTFNSTTLDQMINNGITEINFVWPKEYYEEVAGSNLDDLVTSGTLPDSMVTSLFRIEWYRDGVFYARLTQNELLDTAQDGWDLHGGQLFFPQRVADLLDSSVDTFRLWGYKERALLVNDADVADLTDSQEWGVRAYARWQAFVLLTHDRALFTQWQAQSNNADISPTQLAQMVNLYGGEWQDIRKHLRRLRR